MTKYIKPFLIILSVSWWIAIYTMATYNIYYPSDSLDRLIELNFVTAFLISGLAILKASYDGMTK